MKWLKRGIAWVIALDALLVVSAAVVIVVRAFDPEPFVTPLNPADALALVYDLAAGVKDEQAPVNVRGVETHGVWKDGWDRWIVLELPSADGVSALERDVLEQAGELALQKVDEGAAATIVDGRQEYAYPSKAPPRWWAESKAPDRRPVLISYAAGDSFDLWVFSRSQRRAYLWCDR